MANELRDRVIFLIDGMVVKTNPKQCPQDSSIEITDRILPLVKAAEKRVMHSVVNTKTMKCRDPINQEIQVALSSFFQTKGNDGV